MAMPFETALRLVEIGLALAILQRAAEHIALGDRAIFAAQAVAAVVLVVGAFRAEAALALWLAGLWQLHRFRGPYNGGADKMVLLSLTCLALAHWVPVAQEVALAYLAVQLVLSYFVSGWVKVKNPDWRDGTALAEVFALSAYPASNALRGLAAYPGLMRWGSFAVIGFELAFPIALFSSATLLGALALAAVFHTANACLFGLNRFLWAWLAAFPALIWFQDRIFG